MKRIVGMMIVVGMLFATNAFCEGIDLSGMSAAELAELQSRIQEEINSRPEDHEVLIAQALEVLKAGWKEEYDKNATSGVTFRLDIRGVRVIRIKDELNETAQKIFGDTKYVIEFLFYDDIYSDVNGFSGHKVGYYDYSGQMDSVLVDRQNNMTLSSHPIRNYSGRTYEMDYSSFIEEVTDYRDQYNQIIEF